MNVLITGAAGAVGSHAAERFQALGHQVWGLDSFTDYYDISLKELNARDISAAGVSFIRADLATADLARVLPAETEFIVHFAAQPGISSAVPFETYERNNLIATHRLLEAARSLKHLHGFVFISTSSVYGAHANGSEEVPPTPNSWYGATKLAAEQLALSYTRSGQLPVTALRLFSVYGERERPEKLYRKLIQALYEDKEFTLHEGSEAHVRTFTYVGDAVEGCIRAIDRFDRCRGEIFNVGSNQTATTGEGIALVEELMGARVRFAMVPPRPGDQLETSADIRKAREVFGYDPQTSLRDGLKREVTWFKRVAPELIL